MGSEGSSRAVSGGSPARYSDPVSCDGRLERLIKTRMKIAATADLHFTPQRSDALRDQLSRVRDEADVLVIAGDLTNFGHPEEAEPLVSTLLRLRVPVIVVLG